MYEGFFDYVVFHREKFSIGEKSVEANVEDGDGEEFDHKESDGDVENDVGEVDVNVGHV